MGINIKYLGHSSFLLNIDKTKILTDPYFSNTPLGDMDRKIKCAISLENMKKIDNILISHEHTDNFELKSIEYLIKKFNPKIIAHHSVLNKINSNNYNKISIDEYEIKKINNIDYKAYPAHHPSSFYPLSYLIKSKSGKTIYFAGDTFMTKDHDKIKPDIAILPIGGKRTMDLGTAIRVSKKMKPKILIPMHYNTFEDINKNPEELKYKLEKTSYDINTIILEPGKTYRQK
ncbi:MAG: MBL fold metallo-hydrolase [Candidatus ainarchaeum sp.]|nr:MBL fold metallo-hydrolase [Candidatus ainarchaeum sp.]MDD3975638.1 MBL fold metallo-hydrolase [Candidatus ainarchaeum sp.]